MHVLSGLIPTGKSERPAKPDRTLNVLPHNEAIAMPTASLPHSTIKQLSGFYLPEIKGIADHGEEHRLQLINAFWEMFQNKCIIKP
jgi:hypothetical protein